ncbi:MAG: energy-coupling factor transporter transmembrane component T family protein [Actinomycetota bacterium]
MHQGAWLVWATGTAAIVVSTTNPFYLGPLVAASYVVHVTCRIEGPGVRTFRWFAVGAIVAIFIRIALVLIGVVWPAAGEVNAGTLTHAALEGARLGALLMVFGTFNSVTDPFRLLRLAPARWHEVALASSLALAIAPRTIEAAGRVLEAQRLRGIDVRGPRSLAALAVPVLENGMDDAVLLAESMDARGHGHGRRTRYRPERWTVRSWTGAAPVLAGGLFVGFGIAGAGDLEPSTFPLSWPGASLVLVVAVMLVAAPAFVASARGARP